MNYQHPNNAKPNNAKFVPRPMRSAIKALAIGGSAMMVASASTAETKYTYDKLGRLVTVEYNNQKGSKYFYDAAGNRSSVVTDDMDNLPAAPPEPVNMMTLPIGGLSLLIF